MWAERYPINSIAQTTSSFWAILRFNVICYRQDHKWAGKSKDPSNVPHLSFNASNPYLVYSHQHLSNFCNEGQARLQNKISWDHPIGHPNDMRNNTHPRLISEAAIISAQNNWPNLAEKLKVGTLWHLTHSWIDKMKPLNDSAMKPSSSLGKLLLRDPCTAMYSRPRGSHANSLHSAPQNRRKYCFGVCLNGKKSVLLVRNNCKTFSFGREFPRTLSSWHTNTCC